MTKEEYRKAYREKEEVKHFDNLGQCLAAAVEFLGKEHIDIRNSAVFMTSSVKGSFRLQEKEPYGLMNKEGQPPWKLRVDYDPKDDKYFHINAEAGKDDYRKKKAYCKIKTASCKNLVGHLVTVFRKKGTASEISAYILKIIEEENDGHNPR